MSKLFGTNEKSFKQLMAEFVKSPGIKKQYHKIVLKTTWEENMGTLITKYTKRITLYKGVLTVYVSSSPLRQELNFKKENIKDMFNTALGEELVQQVKIS